MNTWLSVIILIEVTFTLFIAWGLMHEEKFVAFERRVWRKFRRFWRKYNPKRVLAAVVWAVRLEIAERKENR